jgi:hypothetical protein
MYSMHRIDDWSLEAEAYFQVSAGKYKNELKDTSLCIRSTV